MQHARQFDIVDEQRLPGQQPLVLVALDRRAEKSRRHGSSPHRLGRRHHGIDDILIAGAAAEIAGQRLAHLVFGWRGVFAQEGRHGHQDARRAVAALQAVMLVHRLLERMQLAGTGCEPLDGPEFMAIGLHREHQAGTHRRAIEQDRAGAANAVFAADMGAGKQQFVAQKIAEQHPRFDTAAIRRAVDRQLDVVPLRLHGRSADAPRGWRG